MNLLKLFLAIFGFAIASNNVQAKIQNNKTVTVHISGNCEMCKQRIEKAGNLKNVATVDWNGETDQATITYDSIQTTTDDVLKRIADAGYDNEKFTAPDAAYKKLPGCCQYDRVQTVKKEEN